jgi:hypothetical protein
VIQSLVEELSSSPSLLHACMIDMTGLSNY